MGTPDKSRKSVGCAHGLYLFFITNTPLVSQVPEIRPKTSLHDLIVMTLADFREDPKNKDGVSTVKLKNQIKKRFDKENNLNLGLLGILSFIGEIH